MRIEPVNKMCAHLTLHYIHIIVKIVVVHIPPLMAMRLMNSSSCHSLIQPARSLPYHTDLDCLNCIIRKHCLRKLSLI